MSEATQQRTIVLIEDSTTQALQIAAHLTERDLDVMVANDGPQGLRLISILLPAVVILDIYLPSMDGFQVCRRLKRDPHTQDIPVIMLTSATVAEYKAQGLETGAVAYINKDQNAVNALLDVLQRLQVLS